MTKEEIVRNAINDHLDEASREICALHDIIKDEEFPREMRHDAYIDYKAMLEYKSRLVGIRSLLPNLSHEVLKLRFIPDKISELLAEFREIAMRGSGVKDKVELLKCIQDIDTVFKGHQGWMAHYNS